MIPFKTIQKKIETDNAVWLFYKNRTYYIQDIATGNILKSFKNKTELEDYYLTLN